MQRGILINTGKLLVSKLLPALLLTLINVIYSRKLSQSEYGAYQVIWSYLSVCVLFTTFGLPSFIIARFVDLNPASVKKIFRVSFLIGLCFLVPVNIYLYNYSGHFDLIILLFFNILLLSQSVFLIQEAFLVSGNKTERLVWSNGIYAILLFAVHIASVYFISYSLTLIVILIASVSLIRNLILVPVVRMIRMRYSPVRKETTYDISLMLWLGANDTIQILTKWLDKLFLLFLLPLSEYAVYYNGTYELPLVGMLLMAFNTLVTVYSSRQNENKEKVLELFRESSFVMGGLMFPVFSVMFLYGTSLAILLFGEKYKESGELFSLSALFLPMRICSYTTLLQLKNKGRIILEGSILDFVLSIVLMLLLYPLFNIKGLIVAVVVATYIQALYYLFRISLVYQVPFQTILPFKKLGVRLVISVAIITAVKGLSFSYSTWLSLASGIFAGIVLILVFNKNLVPLLLKGKSLQAGESE